MDTLKAYFLLHNMFFYTTTLNRLFYIFQIYTCVLLMEAFSWMFFCSIKETNRLITKRMSNIYLKVTIEEKWCRYSKLQFSKFKNFVSRSVFGKLNSHRYHRIFKFLVATQESDVWEKHCVWLFYLLFQFERNYDVGITNKELSLHLTNFE